LTSLPSFPYTTLFRSVHDSNSVTVVVSTGEGGPGTRRRAARPPSTKNRGIRCKRDDARRSVASCATRPGRYRADQREMSRYATRKVEAVSRSGYPVWCAPVGQISAIPRGRCAEVVVGHGLYVSTLSDA